MHERLRPEDLADRGGERRPPGLGADLRQLLEHLVEAVAGGVGAQARVQRSYEPRWKLVLGRPDCDARRQRGHGLVPEVLVHELRRAPQRVDVDARVEPRPGERARERLPRDPMQRQRNRVDGARDQVRASARASSAAASAFPVAPWQ